MPRKILAQEIGLIEQLGARFYMRHKISTEADLHILCQQFDAVLLSTGHSDAAGLGVPVGKRGIEVTPKLFATELLNVFACGGAIRPCKMAVTAVGDGRAAALSIDRFLHHGAASIAQNRFNSVIGRIQPPEVPECMKDASDAPRLEPTAGMPAGFMPDEAVQEAMRCLHCDCRKPTTCKLRDYAEQYRANQQTYRSTDRQLVQYHLQHELVMYEPGKCIKCGLCVHITEREKERFGMTFIGRGFDVRIDVPMHRDLKAGLAKTAADVVAACPTGALAMKRGEQV